MSDDLRRQAEESVAAYYIEAAHAGREVPEASREQMIAAEVARLQHGQQKRPSSPEPSPSTPERGGAPKKIGGLLKRVLGREISEEEYRLAIETPLPEPVFLCPACRDQGVTTALRERVRREQVMISTINPEIVGIRCPHCPPETQRARNLSGIMPPGDIIRSRFKAFSPHDDSQARALEMVQRWASHEDERAFLILVGPVGVGKSMLAKAAALYRAEHGEGVVWQTAPGILRAIRATFDRLKDNMAASGETGDPSRRYTFAEFVAAPVLAIDDLGREYATDWAATEIEELIFERYEYQRPTIITSNLDLDALGDRQGDPHFRLISRLNDAARCVYLEISGPDHRAGRVSE